MGIFENILSLVGGLALFLFGMSLMAEGLEKRAGDGLRRWLEKLTANRFLGLLLGAGVTALIQSSSAVTVMTVGFVNAGVMTLRQSVGVIMGANIGTTLTAWLLSLTQLEGSGFLFALLKPSGFTPILSAVGAVWYLFSQNEKKRCTGLIFLGFSVLIVGMNAMTDAVKPLAAQEGFQRIFVAFSNPLIGVLTGAILTAILQSSSASVGILQALSATGGITVRAAIPLIMGLNIGTCVTSLLSAVGAEKNARRAATVHLYFNLLGTLILLIPYFVLPWFFEVGFLTRAVTAFDVALIHTGFNLLGTLILFPFAGLLEKLAVRTVR